MAARPVVAAAGSPRDIRDLIKGAHLKLDSLRTVVIAWADEILSGPAEDIEALEAVMNEVPKDAARIVVTSRSEGRVNAFAERYLRRAKRDEDPVDQSVPVAVKYLTVSATNRASALRRLLDDLDPPSAAVVAGSDQASTTVTSVLRVLGYGEDDGAVRATRRDVTPSTYAVIFYELPSPADLRRAAEAAPVMIIALTEPRELDALRRAAGGEVTPLTLAAPANEARQREAAIRRELSSVIDSGLAARDVLALEPLLERHDGIEIAAAALRLLEKERALAAHLREVAQPPRESFSRDARPARGPRERNDRDQRSAGGRGFARGAAPKRGFDGRRDERKRDGRDRPPRRDRS
jgi:ATP-dependent RNA helicase DeaD